MIWVLNIILARILFYKKNHHPFPHGLLIKHGEYMMCYSCHDDFNYIKVLILASTKTINHKSVSMKVNLF